MNTYSIIRIQEIMHFYIKGAYRIIVFWVISEMLYDFCHFFQQDSLITITRNSVLIEEFEFLYCTNWNKILSNFIR